jgi:gentisate 1,2-dioxygenase
MAAVVKSDRAAFSRELASLAMRPLWERTMRLKPGTAAVPAIWRWQDVRPHLARAGDLITAREAERRVLMLENPALPGSTFITTTLYAGLQLILPGEIAPTHRHTPNALRFIVEGEGAYTTVDGERVTMRPGDFVTTPNWTWHDHGNTGSGPVVWLDGLDTAFANIAGAHFREDYPQERQPVVRGDDEASPLLRYPYERTRAALVQLARDADPDPVHGWRLRYTRPGAGGDPFPTMAVFMQSLPAGFAGGPYRTTDGAVFCAVEGRGTVSVGDRSFDFAPHDVFVVPSWETTRFRAAEECVLFSYSDRAAQEALGFWREERA